MYTAKNILHKFLTNIFEIYSSVDKFANESIHLYFIDIKFLKMGKFPYFLTEFADKSLHLSMNVKNCTFWHFKILKETILYS